MGAVEYQNNVASILRRIFGVDLVRTEWDSVERDSHSGNHKLVYAPRHDIAVGPFNPYENYDRARDDAKVMKTHQFTEKLYSEFLKDRDTLRKIWNPLSRCYLAIEIEFNGSSKHMLGGILNASASGAVGIVVVKQKDIDKAERIAKYLMRLEDFGYVRLNMLRNLIIFDSDDFSNFLAHF